MDVKCPVANSGISAKELDEADLDPGVKTPSGISVPHWVISKHKASGSGEVSLQ